MLASNLVIHLVIILETFFKIEIEAASPATRRSMRLRDCPQAWCKIGPHRLQSVYGVN